MNTFIRTHEFDNWLKALKDVTARLRITNRILQAQNGNFGDCKPVGDGISEMRIFVGPGYRVYYTRRGEVVYLLLCGGSKGSQKRDIKLAKSILDEIEKEERK
ncbi:addiction module protein [Pseudomonas sp. ATCC PTA-122608]|uniref:type II toxin-antitoxin system RelE/ParE family toxin n=1 Tax=Pseudomonas sp. ATCC PTA-122608 TaxID=1771311 RepID=UPI00096BA1DD|nr:type II toxin-antitoxin system RelE/ParE family toxin [Pseudomonas sp. ATCC PTA-122608]OLY72256.1 addiction module protein [Pseudomonas sp. ATCC PTA-122608]